MSIYGINQMQVVHPYDVSGISIDSAYDVNGNSVFENEPILGQEYLGGYIEIQPDSWDGTTAVTGDIVEPNSTTAWGFPMSLSASSKANIKSDILNGITGIRYIRFPMGFAYRGYRNVDETTGLAKNIGERWRGQNNSLHEWFSNIAQNGGGLAPEYWCIAPYWLTGGAYYNADVVNEVWAGGLYSRTTTLASIRESDRTQYNAQIEALTDAIVNDLEYLHQNIAPVRMFGLSNEPNYGNMKYGACAWQAQTYNDVLAVLYPKILASDVLSEYNGAENTVLLHCASDDSNYFTSEGATYIANYPGTIWGYSYHAMRYASGENGDGADSFYKSATFDSIKGSKNNLFINEYEYFSTSSRTDEFRCGNNMVHLIDEMVYGGAKVLHPIIHICKPTGQTSAQTNTTGYCLYAVDMSDGSYTVNTWAYNSWKMFSDNLPIGARLVKNYFVDISGVGFMTVIKNNKLCVFAANCSSVAKTLTLGFFGAKTFQTKLYNMTNLGTVTGLSETITNLVVPANSGVCCIEN